MVRVLGSSRHVYVVREKRGALLQLELCHASNDPNVTRLKMSFTHILTALLLRPAPTHHLPLHQLFLSLRYIDIHAG